MMLARALLAATLLLTPGIALAGGETEIFTLDSSDGYGIDSCIASGAACGAAMAGAWCRAHDFERAVSFGKVQNDVTVATVSTEPVRTACYGGVCAETVAITCAK